MDTHIRIAIETIVICGSNIKVESNYDNCSFVATFGDIERKQGKKIKDYNGNYYL